jgi:transcriptional regulator with XRE-family HTH domain
MSRGADRIDEEAGGLASVLRFPSNGRSDPPPETERGLRTLIGDVLREERHRQDRTLADVAADAAISVPYLSEVERGRKEVSSDLLDAIGTALDLPLVEILERSAERLRTDVRMVERMVEMSVRSGEFRGQSATRFQLAA